MQNLEQLQGEIKAILSSEMTDGVKLLAVAQLVTAASTASELARRCNKSIRTVERHYAYLRSIRKSADTQSCVEYANLRTETTQICVEKPLARVEDNKTLSKLEDRPVSEVKCSSSRVKPKTTQKRGSRLPDDWELPEDWRQWTLTNCLSSSPETVKREAQKFANYWQAKPGKDACKLDWRKTWQNWSLQAFATAPLRPTPSAPNTVSIMDVLARRKALAEAVQ